MNQIGVREAWDTQRKLELQLGGPLPIELELLTKKTNWTTKRPCAWSARKGNDVSCCSRASTSACATNALTISRHTRIRVLCVEFILITNWRFTCKDRKWVVCKLECHFMWKYIFYISMLGICFLLTYFGSTRFSWLYFESLLMYNYKLHPRCHMVKMKHFRTLVRQGCLYPTSSLSSHCRLITCTVSLKIK